MPRDCRLALLRVYRRGKGEEIVGLEIGILITRSQRFDNSSTPSSFLAAQDLQRNLRSPLASARYHFRDRVQSLVHVLFALRSPRVLLRWILHGELTATSRKKTRKGKEREERKKGDVYRRAARTIRDPDEDRDEERGRRRGGERRAGKKVGALDPPVNKTLGET